MSKQANPQAPMPGILLALGPPSLASLGSSSPGHAGSPLDGLCQLPLSPTGEEDSSTGTFCVPQKEL